MVWEDNRAALVVWRSLGADVAKVVTRPEWLEAHGSADIAGALGRAIASLVLIDATGRAIAGTVASERRPSAARQYRLERCEVGALLQSVAARFGAEVARRGYEVVTTLPSDLPDVRADADALTLAIWNLLDNAVKYSPVCKTVWLEASDDGASVLISVKDRGLGISKEEASRVFDTFTRGSNATASGAGGTGLGLSIVRHIVEARHGSITLESKPGEGSTFTLRLPVEA